ncbi:MAG: hypothetical protein ABH817_00555 [archaeon]
MDQEPDNLEDLFDTLVSDCCGREFYCNSELTGPRKSNYFCMGCEKDCYPISHRLYLKMHPEE